MKSKVIVGIVEDDAAIRSLICEYLNRLPEIECRFEVHSVERFFEYVSPNDTLHVLLQDINLPGMSGLQAIKKIKRRHPNTEILMFTVHNDSSKIFKAFCAGASGYLLKNTRLPDIRKAILDLHNGQSAMSPSIARKVVDHFKPKKSENTLTKKENLVVQLITEGLSYKMVADRMQISENTARSHIKNIYRKLHINSKAELISKNLRGEI